MLIFTQHYSIYLLYLLTCYLVVCCIYCIYLSDLVFCTNVEGEPVVLPQEYRDLPPTALKRPLGKHGQFKWNAVVVAGRNSFIRNTEELRGNYLMRRRQLDALGYYVSVVSWFLLPFLLMGLLCCVCGKLIITFVPPFFFCIYVINLLCLW